MTEQQGMVTNQTPSSITTATIPTSPALSTSSKTENVFWPRVLGIHHRREISNGTVHRLALQSTHKSHEIRYQKKDL